MIGIDHCDGLACDFSAEIRDRHPHRFNRSRSGRIGVKSGLIGQDANLHRIVGYLRVGGSSCECDRQGCRARSDPSKIRFHFLVFLLVDLPYGVGFLLPQVDHSRE
jgi:hypothetical protein